MGGKPSKGTKADRRLKRNKPKLGSGARFASLKKSLAKRGARNPGALAAYIGRKTLGKARFQKLAARGRARARH